MKEQMKKFKESIINRYFEEDEDAKENVQEDVSYLSANEVEESVEEDISTSPLSIFKHEPKIEVKPEVQVAVVEKPSTISKTTEITGNINTQSDLFINGKIFGDIVTTGHIEITGGTVIGNIKAASVIINNSKVQGNIESQFSMDIHSNSEITGNIKSERATIDCLCQGNIYINETLHLSAHADIKGDIQIKGIKIDEGAVVDGRIKVKK
ncbi:MAG: polymer-forming cytoskeletal protein [Coprobacillus sp.]